MAQITISKPVGQGAIGALPTDIKTIQALLASLKDKKFKPLYAGRIEGKAGPKTIAGICTFQILNNIKEPGGIVRPVSSTMNKLMAKATPAALKAIAAATMGEIGAATTATVQATVRAASAIRRSAPFPDAYAKSLENIVKTVGQRGIPLKLDYGDISQDGRWMAIMKIDRASLPGGLSENELKQKAAKCLMEALSSNADWKLERPGHVTLVGVKAHAKLTGLGEPSAAFLEEMGVQLSALSGAQKRLMAAVEKLSNDGEF